MAAQPPTPRLSGDAPSIVSSSLLAPFLRLEMPAWERLSDADTRRWRDPSEEAFRDERRDAVIREARVIARHDALDHGYGAGIQAAQGEMLGMWTVYAEEPKSPGAALGAREDIVTGDVWLREAEQQHHQALQLTDTTERVIAHTDAREAYRQVAYFHLQAAARYHAGIHRNLNDRGAQQIDGLPHPLAEDLAPALAEFERERPPADTAAAIAEDLSRLRTAAHAVRDTAVRATPELFTDRTHPYNLDRTLNTIDTQRWHSEDAAFRGAERAATTTALRTQARAADRPDLTAVIRGDAGELLEVWTVSAAEPHSPEAAHLARAAVEDGNRALDRAIERRDAAMIVPDDEVRRNFARDAHAEFGAAASLYLDAANLVHAGIETAWHAPVEARTQGLPARVASDVTPALVDLARDAALPTRDRDAIKEYLRTLHEHVLHVRERVVDATPEFSQALAHSQVHDAVGSLDVRNGADAPRTRPEPRLSDVETRRWRDPTEEAFRDEHRGALIQEARTIAHRNELPHLGVTIESAQGDVLEEFVVLTDAPKSPVAAREAREDITLGDRWLREAEHDHRDALRASDDPARLVQPGRVRDEYSSAVEFYLEAAIRYHASIAWPASQEQPNRPDGLPQELAKDLAPRLAEFRAAAAPATVLPEDLSRVRVAAFAVRDVVASATPELFVDRTHPYNHDRMLDATGTQRWSTEDAAFRAAERIAATAAIRNEARAAGVPRLSAVIRSDTGELLETWTVLAAAPRSPEVGLLAREEIDRGNRSLDRAIDRRDAATGVSDDQSRRHLAQGARDQYRAAANHYVAAASVVHAGIEPEWQGTAEARAHGLPARLAQDVTPALVELGRHASLPTQDPDAIYQHLLTLHEQVLRVRERVAQAIPELSPVLAYSYVPPTCDEYVGAGGAASLPPSNVGRVIQAREVLAQGDAHLHSDAPERFERAAHAYVEAAALYATGQDAGGVEAARRSLPERMRAELTPALAALDRAVARPAGDPRRPAAIAEVARDLRDRVLHVAPELSSTPARLEPRSVDRTSPSPTSSSPER